MQTHELTEYDLEREEWRELDFDCRYHISNLGRVRSYVRDEPTLLKERQHTRGYLRVQISSVDYYIHTLVARMFKDNTRNLLEINHEDGNKKNNRASNLEYSTRAENLSHACRLGLRTPPLKGRLLDDNPFTKITTQELLVVLHRFAAGESVEALADELGLGFSTLKKRFTSVIGKTNGRSQQTVAQEWAIATIMEN